MGYRCHPPQHRRHRLSLGGVIRGWRVPTLLSLLFPLLSQVRSHLYLLGRGCCGTRSGKGRTDATAAAAALAALARARTHG